MKKEPLPKKKKEPLAEKTKKKKEPSEVRRARKRRLCSCFTRAYQSKRQHKLPSHQHLNRQSRHGKADQEEEEY
jgi:hypothetical protein